MKKVLLLFFLTLFVFASASAQRKKKDTLNICRPGSYVLCDLGGGLHTMNYSLDGYGRKTPGFGGLFRVGYRYFLENGFGVGIDLNFRSYGSNGEFNYTNAIEGAIDTDNEVYEHRTYYAYLKERQRQTMIGIPIGVYYHHKLEKKLKIGGGIGALTQFVAFDKFKTRAHYVETRGYYQQYRLELFDMPQHYFYKDDNFSGHYNYKPSFGAFLEFDIMYVLNPRLDLNFGFYSTYGFNNQKDTYNNYQFDPDCMSPDAYQNPIYNGVLASNVVDKIHPLSLGLMAGVRYRLVSSPKSKIPDEEKPKKEKTEKEKKDKKDKPGKDEKNKPDNKPEIDSTDYVPPIIIEDDDDDNGSLVPKREENPKKDEQPKVEDEPKKEDEQPKVEDEPKKEDEQPKVEDEPKKEDEQPKVEDEPKKEDEPKEEFKERTFVAVNFDFNRADIKTKFAYNKMFDDITEIAKEYPEAKIKIVGHTCDIGTAEQNDALGLKRAESAKELLVKRGVSPDRIICESMGLRKPLVPNTSEANRAKNRRIEIIITQ